MPRRSPHTTADTTDRDRNRPTHPAGLSDLSRLPGDPSRSRYRAPFADSGGAAATQQPPLRGGRPPLTFVRPGADAFRAAGSIAKYLRECPSLVVGCSPEAAGLAVRALAVAHDYVAEREPYGLVFQLHSARLRPSDSRPEVLFTAFKCPTAFAQRVISVSTNGEAPPPPTQTPPAPPVRATSAAARAASVDTPSSGRSSSSGGSDGGDALPRPQRHRGMVLEVARESTPEKLAGKLMGMFLTYGCMTLQLSHPAAIAAAAGALLLARQRLLASGVRSDMTITTSRRSAAAASGGSSSSSTFAPSGGDAAIPAAATGAASTNNLADGGPDGGGGDDSSGPPPLQLHVVGTRPLMPLQMINLPKFRRTQKARLAAQRAEQRPQQEPE